MQKVNLVQVNKAVKLLTEATSNKNLYEQIVKTATIVIGSDYGKLFLYSRDHLKKTYYSDEKIKVNTLVRNKNFNKLLATNEMFEVKRSTLSKWKIKNLPDEISFLVVVPLVTARQQLGFLFLYFIKRKNQLTPTERELLTLYSHTVVLALNKVKLQEESKKALEIRDRFISVASHELRTPLTSIHGYIQLLHNRVKGQKNIESRWIKELFIESIRMTQLIKELLDVNRIKQGQFAFVFSEVPIYEVVRRAIDRYRILNANHPFIFQSKLENDQLMIVGDFDKLVEMVSGLLGNAVKFSKPGEKITVVIKNSQKFVTLIVKDKGKGISQKDLSAILGGFYKPEEVTHIEGMGVGLLLAQHIVMKHRGKLKIQSKENEGTSVTVSLPTVKSIA
jgi:two-component system, sensor histidine kinase